MANDILIKLKFDRKVGDYYYFLAGFYNEGYALPSTPLGGGRAQHDLLTIPTSIPLVLSQGQQIGLYTVPERLELRGIKGAPWISDTSLMVDLMINWIPALGFLYLEWYEVLYMAIDGTLPDPYAGAHQSAEEAPNGWSYALPKDPSLWPPIDGPFTSMHVADAVSQAGAQLSVSWAFLYTGGMQEAHMLDLIGSGPLEPEEPDIDVRWRDEHATSGMINTWGSYDTRYPQYNFDGYNNLYNGFPNGRLISVAEGVADFGDVTVIVNDPAIIPYLSNTRYGESVSAQVPKALPGNDAFLFPGPYTPSPVSIFPALATLTTLAQFCSAWIPFAGLRTGGSEFIGLADDTYPFAGDSTPLYTNKE